MRARVVEQHVPVYEDPIEVMKGETIVVGAPDPENQNWIWCTAEDGREGWVPKNLILEDNTIRRDYTAQELYAELGEDVDVEATESGWAFCSSMRGLGWIPLGKLDF